MWELEDFSDDKIVSDPLDILANTRKELVHNLEGKDDLEIKDGDMSWHSGFDGSIGSIINWTDNSERNYFIQKQRALDLVSEKAKNADLANKNR